MRSVRRNDLSPRVEIVPLIDVIFLLLTFFIYSMVVMVHANVLPVDLTPLAAGATEPSRDVQVVTIDRDGKFYFNRKPVDAAMLDERLAAMSKVSDQTLFLGLEAVGRVDRGPLLVTLIERTQAAGVTNIVIVGNPRQAVPLVTPGGAAKGVD